MFLSKFVSASTIENTYNNDFPLFRNLTIKEQVDMIMSQLHSKQQRRVETIKAEVISPTSTSATTAPTTLPRVVSPVKSSPIPRPQKTADPLLEKKPRAKHRMVNAYGSSGKAAKTRRCGE